MSVKIIILDFNTLIERAKKLRVIWERYIAAKEGKSCDSLIVTFYFYPTARKLFPRLFDLTKQLDRLTAREMELIKLERVVEEREGGLKLIKEVKMSVVPGVEEELKRIKEEKERIKGKIWEEAESIWSTIDTRVIDSFKDLIRNVTGSDELADIYRREVERVNILNSIRNAKYEHDYREMEHIICEQLYETTVRWFQEIKRLARL